MTRKRFPERCACFGFPPDENRSLFEPAPANPGTPGVFAFQGNANPGRSPGRRKRARPGRRAAARLDGPGRGDKTV